MYIHRGGLQTNLIPNRVMLSTYFSDAYPPELTKPEHFQTSPTCIDGYPRGPPFHDGPEVGWGKGAEEITELVEVYGLVLVSVHLWEYRTHFPLCRLGGREGEDFQLGHRIGMGWPGSREVASFLDFPCKPKRVSLGTRLQEIWVVSAMHTCVWQVSAIHTITHRLVLKLLYSSLFRSSRKRWSIKSWPITCIMDIQLNCVPCISQFTKASIMLINYCVCTKFAVLVSIANTAKILSLTRICAYTVYYVQWKLKIMYKTNSK